MLQYFGPHLPQGFRSSHRATLLACLKVLTVGFGDRVLLATRWENSENRVCLTVGAVTTIGHRSLKLVINGANLLTAYNLISEWIKPCYTVKTAVTINLS